MANKTQNRRPLALFRTDAPFAVSTVEGCGSSADYSRDRRAGKLFRWSPFAGKSCSSLIPKVSQPSARQPGLRRTAGRAPRQPGSDRRAGKAGESRFGNWLGEQRLTTCAAVQTGS